MLTCIVLTLTEAESCRVEGRLRLAFFCQQLRQHLLLAVASHVYSCGQPRQRLILTFNEHMITDLILSNSSLVAACPLVACNA